MFKSENKKGVPIGGWLYFWGVGLIIFSVLSLIGFINGLIAYTDFEVGQNGLISTNYYKVLMEYQILFWGTILIFSFILHYYFWNRRKEFILAFFIFGIVVFLLVMFQEILSNIEGFSFYTATFVLGIINTIGFTYLKKSTRVKQTFLLENLYIKITKEEYDQLKNTSQ